MDRDHERDSYRSLLLNLESYEPPQTEEKKLQYAENTKYQSLAGMVYSKPQQLDISFACFTVSRINKNRGYQYPEKRKQPRKPRKTLHTEGKAAIHKAESSYVEWAANGAPDDKKPQHK